MVRMTSEMETNIIAVERVKEYTEIETEVIPSCINTALSLEYIKVNSLPS